MANFPMKWRVSEKGVFMAWGKFYNFPPRGKIYLKPFFCLKRCYGIWWHFMSWEKLNRGVSHFFGVSGSVGPFAPHNGSGFWHSSESESWELWEVLSSALLFCSSLWELCPVFYCSLYRWPVPWLFEGKNSPVTAKHPQGIPWEQEWLHN